MTLLRSILLGGLCCGAVLTAGGEATLEGTVKLPKPAAGAEVIRRYEHVAPGAIGPAPRPVAVVYLEGNFPATTSSNSTIKAEMVQEHFRFAPGVLPVRTGTAVEFPNRDDAYHNVFSYSKTKRFDLGRYQKDEKPPAIVFDKPGAVKLFCEIHEHMRATILVLDTPHFTRTDTNGNFRLEHLPAGKFTLKVWLNDKIQMERPVELSDGATARVDLPSN